MRKCCIQGVKHLSIIETRRTDYGRSASKTDIAARMLGDGF
jgi:hypothetical protein